MRDRLTIVERPPGRRAADLAAAVHAGLTAPRKHVPCCFFYDEAGARLFEEICALPEYYLTRAEEEILRRHADTIVAAVPPGAALVELGSGSAAKTRLLIAAALRRAPALRYVPIDICRGSLEGAARGLLADFPGLTIQAVAAEYEDGLPLLGGLAEETRLILWLGSNVGNLHRPEAAAFLRRLREAMGPADRFLLGADLRKGRAELEAAYADAAGVTARFNLNLLARINRELDADFELEAFAHHARYDEDAGRIEMYLVSRNAQRVAVRALGLTVAFAAGEALHTENSYKYSPAELDALAAGGGMAVVGRWLDQAGRFSVTLMRPADA